MEIDTRGADGLPARTTAFDKVVIATHADTALALLTDAGEDESDVLGCFGYSTNTTYLHRDEGYLPSHPSAAGPAGTTGSTTATPAPTAAG